MITHEKCNRESQDPLASERRSKMQFSHLEHRADLAETAAVSQFLQELFGRIASPLVSMERMQRAFAISRHAHLNPQ